MLNTKSLLSCTSAALLASLAFIACGDENTYVTGAGTMPVLESGKMLSEQACGQTNVGGMLFAVDSSAAFLCDGERWISQKGEKGDKGEPGEAGAKGEKGEGGINGVNGEAGAPGTPGDKGEQGEPGEKGEPGEAGAKGADGSSCTAKSVEKGNRTGYELTCGGAVVDTLWNGVDGEPGEKGEPGEAGAKGEKGDQGEKGDKGDTGAKGADGSSCSAAKVAKDGRDGVEISCAGVVIDTLWNGLDGDVKSSSSSSSGEESSSSLDGRSEYDAAASTLTDFRNGKVYRTVVIGEGESAQTWMAENLDYAYGAGTYDMNLWYHAVSDSISWCPGNDPANCDKYGRLYTWAAAMDSAALFSEAGTGCGYNKDCKSLGTVRGICPEGWHLPSNAEWKVLLKPLASEVFDTEKFWNYYDAGTKLKSTSGWLDDDGKSGNGTDVYGFSALPAGSWHYDGDFSGEGKLTAFWSSDEVNVTYAYSVIVKSGDHSADLSNGNESCGLSVRCIKDR